MKKLHLCYLKSFDLKIIHLKPFWIFGAIIIIQILFGNGFAQNQDWLNKVYLDGYGIEKIGNITLNIEYENFPLYLNNENKIKITSSDKNAKFKVLLPNEKPIEFRGSHILVYKPSKIFTDKAYIITGKDTITRWIGVIPMPNPTLFFDSTNQNVLLRDEIFTTNLQARIKNKSCKILKYRIVFIKDGVYGSEYSSYGTTVTNQDSTFTNPNRKRISFLEDGANFYLADVLVEMPDGSTRIIDYQKIKLIKHKYQRSYCNKLWFDITPFITKSFCNLRVKIETDSLKSKIKIFESFFEELNQEMNGVKVKLVTVLPDITFSNSKYLYSSNKSNNFFYPEVLNTNDYKISFKRVWSEEENDYHKEDVDGDQLIEVVLNQIGIKYNKSTVRKDSLGYYHLTPNSKEHLKNLYSNGSIHRIYKELKIENPNDKRQNFILFIVLISLIIFLIIKELTNSIQFTRKLFISKPAFWKSLITYPLVAQIPLMIYLIIRYINESKITLDYIITAEKYYIVYAILVGIMLWSLDKLQHKIHSFALRLLLDFMATIFIFWTAYQLIFMATHLDYVRLDMLRWQWIYIPLAVAFYRLFNLFMQRKMDQMMQEKELEISKQKEMTTKAELLALQSRINPHFLYNSLNSIASLSATDSLKTEQMAINLSKLFRYNLNKGDDLMTTIEEELEMVKLYLDIEKQRFGDRLDYRVEISEELMKYQIPIFLLQPLVENAIKHGISKITESGVIKISIEKSDDCLSIKVFDNGPAFTNEPIHGYGLQNIFDKLTLVYKSNYSMQFVNEPEKYIEIAIWRKK